MQPNPAIYQPGVILYDAIMGAFRANGKTLQAWCEQNDLSPSMARNVAFGQMRGERGQIIRAKLIAAAGPEMVQASYHARLKAHHAELFGEAA